MILRLQYFKMICPSWARHNHCCIIEDTTSLQTMSKIATFVSVAALVSCLLLALVILQERRQLYERVGFLERLAHSGTVIFPLEQKMQTYSSSWLIAAKAYCSVGFIFNFLVDPQRSPFCLHLLSGANCLICYKLLYLPYITKSDKQDRKYTARDCQ